MKRELALLLKAQSQTQILDTAGKTRSNRVPCSDNNESSSRKRAKRMTLDDPVPAKLSVAENEDSKSEISSSKEHLADKCLSIANADTGLTEDMKKSGMGTTVKTRSSRFPCSDNNTSRDRQTVKGMTLDDPMPADFLVADNEDLKSEISSLKDPLPDQCLSITTADTGLMEDLKKTGMESHEGKIVLGLASRNEFLRKGNQNLKNEEEAEAKGELKVSVDQQKPLRRFTRSLLKTKKDPEDLPLENRNTVVDEADNITVAEEVKNMSGVKEENVDLNFLGTPENIIDMGDSPHSVIDKIPQTIRELLETGLLEGYPVYYSGGKKGPIIHGLIKGNGILCACGLCKGAKVVAPSRFGIHAIDSYQRATEKICLKNGRSLKKVLHICRKANLNTLPMRICETIGPLPEKRMASCGNCNDSFLTTIVTDVELLCSSCMNILSTPRNPGKKSGQASRPSKSTLSLKSGTPVLARLQSSSYATDRAEKEVFDKKYCRRIQLAGGLLDDAHDKKIISPDAYSTPTLSRRIGKRSRESIQTPMLSVDSSVAGSSKKKAGKITTKDFLRNRAVFERLPDGTELSYFAHGERLLSGYKQDLGIFCFCCNSVVSASLFEAHAGNAKHKKPYDNIYTSDGLSLHDLALSIRKENGRPGKEHDSLCSICEEGDSLLECDGCPRAFHRECADVTCEPGDKWYCRYCQSLFERGKVRISANAIAAGWTEGVDPLEKIGELCMRTLKDTDDFTFCHLCSGSDFERSAFGPRTILLCDQCEKEYHISCLKEHGIADLNELPHGTWFCGDACRKIHASLQVLLSEGSLELPSSLLDSLWKKYEQEVPGVGTDLSWMLLSGQLLQQDSRKAKVKRLFSQAISVLHFPLISPYKAITLFIDRHRLQYLEGFGSILTHGGGRDLIPPIVYGRDLKSNRDYSGMYCAVLLLKDVIISVAVFRVFGQDVMELPLVATRKDYRGKGYFQALFGCIESFLSLHHVKSIVLPAAEEAEGVWLRLGFKRMTPEQHSAYKKVYWKMVEFDGIVMLEKEVQGPLPADKARLDHEEAGPSETHCQPTDAEQSTAIEGAGSKLESQPADSQHPISEEASRCLSLSQVEEPESSSLKVQPGDTEQSLGEGIAVGASVSQMDDSTSSQLNLLPEAEHSLIEEAAGRCSEAQMEPEISLTFLPDDVQLFPDKATDSVSQSQIGNGSSLKFHVPDAKQPIIPEPGSCDPSQSIMPEPA